MLRRKITDELAGWKKSKSKECLLIRGARQVGKTYIVEQFAKDNYKSVVIIDFVKSPELCKVFEGNLDVDNLIFSLSTIFRGTVFEPGNTLIFFDEIQQCPRARASLKYFAIDGRFDVIASGSLLGLEVKSGDFIPMGYERDIHMRQLDFEEFLWAIGLDDRVIDEVKSRLGKKIPMGDAVLEAMNRYLRMYMLVGGMPEAVQAFVDSKDYNRVRSVHTKLMTDYRYDISKYALKTEVLKVGSCLESVKEQLAKRNKRFRYSEVQEMDYKVGIDFYSYALHWLTASDIVLMMPSVTEPHRPLDERINRRMFKLYMRDTGLLISMYPDDIAPEILEGNLNVNRGAITENAVISMLEQNDRPLFYYEKTESPRMEIDAILTIGCEVTAVEIKSGNDRRSRSLNRFREVFGLPGIRFENKDVFTDELGVTHYPLFAAAFINSIDPKPSVKDETDMESENRRLLSVIDKEENNR